MLTERSPLTAQGQQQQQLHHHHQTAAPSTQRLAITFAAAVVVFGAALASLLWPSRTLELLAPDASSTTASAPAGASIGTDTGAGATSASTSGAGTNDHLDGFFCGLTGFETGYVTLRNKQDDHYFYWFVASATREPNSDPLVLWLTGGPGAPGSLALLTENGPCIVQPDLTTRRNEYAWTNNASVIWLDQPTSVGFSYGAPEDADTNENNVGENIYWFLQGFFDKHPELQDRDFFITGESYGGHYVPAAAHYIWEQNKRKEHKAINLQGIAIGNGLTDPAIQNPHYIDMLDNAYNVMFANASALAEARAAAQECERKRKRKRSASRSAGAAAAAAAVANDDDGDGDDDDVDGADACNADLVALMNGAKRNPYDIRKSCEEANTNASKCIPTDHVRAYLEQPGVRALLNVSARANPWQMVNMDVNSAFTASGDVDSSMSPLVADLLDDNVRVLIYAGDADLMCNWYGNAAWTKALEWSGKSAFNAATERAYVTASGVDAGVVRATGDRRFAFVRLYNSGHMVPQDQPEVALDMLTKFLADQAL